MLKNKRLKQQLTYFLILLGSVTNAQTFDKDLEQVYKNYPYQIPFTPNLYFDFKIINNTNNNFLTISYLNKQNILSQVKHYKMN